MNNPFLGFVEVRNCIVFKGAYPPKLLQLWDDFDREKTSENSRPDYLPSDQLYVALEFNNGGKDLEKYEFRHAGQALAAWKQVVHTLAVAESEMHFEHRDLHWGNVLIKENASVVYVKALLQGALKWIMLRVIHFIANIIFILTSRASRS